MTRKTDSKARVTLPRDFASCLVTIERHGDELRLRKAKKVSARRYTFRELMDQVTPDNLHAEVDFGGPVGKELL
jgi:antitoxin component of MazEF toxin-antitoxin module